MKRSGRHGFTLPFVAMVAFGLAIILLFVSRTIKVTTGQMVYFNNMNRAYRLAESGLSNAIGILSVEASTEAIDGIAVSIAGEGEYVNYVQRVSTPIFGAYYILTIATRTEAGRTYACKLHTIANVANIGEYFAAVTNSFTLSHGMDATGGKLYAPNLTFNYTTNNPPKTTVVGQAEYLYSCIASNITVPENPVNNSDPASWEGAAIMKADGSGYISIGTGAELPVQLTNLKTFPKLGAEEMNLYKERAGPHTWKNVFSETDIYPPGYELDGVCDGTGDGYYAGGYHTEKNIDHIYYSSDVIKIGLHDSSQFTKIHGQVLFISEKNIEIEGNIVSADPGDCLPGAGQVSSSTAHQAVFITPADIEIKTYYQTKGATTTVQGFFIAPTGELFVQNTGDDNTQKSQGLGYNFLGSEILGTIREKPENLPSQFRGTRIYGYMQSLKTHPPPYLPSLAEIYYSLEEITESPNLY